MAVLGYTEDSFGTKLGEVLSASRPIHTIEHLRGRSEELNIIKKSLYAPGRHVFIYGDRGVGKSSLGQTAAYQYQSSDAPPIFVSGSPTEKFNTLIANIVSQATKQPRIKNVKSSSSISAGVNFKFANIKYSGVNEQNNIDIASAICTIGDAVEFLKSAAKEHSEKPIVVIDEFDTISDPAERNMFASLLKQMGDQSINLKFIFTGVGKSLDELLGTHQSAYRQFEAIELNRLGWNARLEIVQSAIEAFDLELNEHVNYRIGMISDGFPYYIHLITEKILWAAFSAEENVTEIGWELFNQGVLDAIVSTVPELKRPYQKAVVSREPEFEDIVWATADHEDMLRSLDAMYKSYLSIVDKRYENHKAIDKKRFSTQVRKLKKDTYGAILQQEVGRPGWYSYREKMLRGFVRMQAQANGIELSGEQITPKQLMHIGNVRSGYRGPSIPRGVHQNQKISEWDDS